MMRSRDLELCECTRPSSEADAGACPHDRCVLDTGDVAAGLEDILEVGLDRPAGIDLVGIADFDQRLVIARHRLAEIDVEGRDLVGDAGIGKADGKGVVGAGPGSCR